MINATVIVQEDDWELGHIASIPDCQFRMLRRSVGFSASLHTHKDWLIVLGSDWSVVDGRLSDLQLCEFRLIERALERGIPVLGICYGAQVLARIFGSTVERMQCPEFGWQTIQGHLRSDIFSGEWFQWHYDHFSIPAGALLHASNESCTQAFEFGRSLGIQFHPEITTGVVERWMDLGGTSELRQNGSSIEEVETSTCNFTVGEERFLKLVQWYLKSVAQLL